MAVAPDNPQLVFYAVSGGISSRVGDSNYYPSEMFKSTDGGLTWNEINLPNAGATSYFCYIKATDSNNLYALGTRIKDVSFECVGLIRSRDGGLTWSQITPPPNFTIDHFDIDPNNPDIIYIVHSYSSEVQKSTDGGSTWSPFGDLWPSGPLAVSPFHPNTILVADNNRLYKISNGGAATLVLTTEAFISKIVYAPSDPNVVYVGARHYCIYKSTDGGNTFTKLESLRDYINSH